MGGIMYKRDEILSIIASIAKAGRSIDRIIDEAEEDCLNISQDEYYDLRTVQVALDDICVDLNMVISKLDDLPESLLALIEMYDSE
jgi:hypothetical protein